MSPANTPPLLIAMAICISVTMATFSSRPNIILIVADDLGWNDVGFHGSEIPTPNIDSLAYDGIILNNYYVQPICTPSRSALMTGRHPIHTGMQHGVIVGSAPYGVSLNEILMPQYLRALDYSSHIVGKWHLGFFAQEYTPTFRGFESHYGYYSGMEDYYDHTYCSFGTVKDVWGLDFRDNMDVVKTAFGQYSTELFSSRAEEIIQKHNQSKPLFLYLPFQAVHSGNPITPLEAPYKYLQKVSHIKDTKRRLFAGMVSALDDAIGNVTRSLHQHGMLGNSIIIFTTDNGGPAAGFDFNQASNWPLRGVKSLLWEGGVRGAGFVWSPKLKKNSYVAQQMMTIYDWLPTILRAAGFNMSVIPDKVDGLDQWDVLNYNISSRREELLHNIDPKQKTAAIRHRNIKLIMGDADSGVWDGWYRPDDHNQALHDKLNPGQEDALLSMNQNTERSENADQEGVVHSILKSLGRKPKNGKPIRINCGPKPANASTNCQPAKAPCLFDIENDPCEYHNLADTNPDVVAMMMGRLRAHNATAVTPRNKKQDPRGFPVYHNHTWVPWVKLTHQALYEDYLH